MGKAAFIDRTGVDRTLPILRFGIVSDAHYANAPSRGSRHYRLSLSKMTECVARLNALKVDFLVQLGDLKDERQPSTEAGALEDLGTIKAVIDEFNGPRYHVLGNHDLDGLSKTQVLKTLGNPCLALPQAAHYAFTSKGVRFIVLDANFTSEGNGYDHGNFHWADAYLPNAQCKWLRLELEATTRPVIVFIHQLLDGNDSYCVKNAAAVRQILRQCPRLMAVFQGHHHAGRYRCLDAVHYYTLRGVIEGAEAKDNAYAVVAVYRDGRMQINGYRRAESLLLHTSRPA